MAQAWCGRAHDKKENKNTIDMAELPGFLKRLDPDAKEIISQDERDKLMWFNTEEYWHCCYDVKTNILYDQFGVIILKKGFDYLVDKGFIDKDKNIIKSDDLE